MNRHPTLSRLVPAAVVLASALAVHGKSQQTGGRQITVAKPAVKTIAEADCTAAKLGSGIPASAIGEPVSAVTLNAPQ